MRAEFISSIKQVNRQQWNSIAGTDYPFTRHEFLQALEESGACTRESGWQPHHLLIFDQQHLLAVMPLYLKYHSYGEYVFDWSWADAYQRNGLNYYPKLLAAIPYTPATGPRLCIDDSTDRHSLLSFACDSLLIEAEQQGASSLHLLFPEVAVSEQLQQQQFNTRHGVQFHWFNRGYSSFDDFLADFSSRKRKNLRKERLRVQQQGLRLEVLEGSAIPEEAWQHFYHFYQLTYAKRSGHGGYLDLAFFQQIARDLPQHLVLVMATFDGQYVAGALNFRDSQTLYGRYWGCSQEFDYLHFEACYYQGIDYCIKHALQRFDPGAQGEHKIQRGFTPTRTYSNHKMLHADFNKAVADFLRREAEGMEQYLQDMRALLPFKQ